MRSTDYWVEFWQKSEIIKKENLHEKVGRTINGTPISNELWEKTLENLKENLRLSSHDTLLDIGAGSGLITEPFSKTIKHVTAVDLSEELMKSISDTKKITKIVGDIRKIDFKDNQFTKIVFYFAIQHFDEREIIFLFEKIYNWLDSGGIFYIGDVPDLSRQFNFFNNKERLGVYFNSIKKQEPIIGTWFDKEFLVRLARYIGFTNVEIIHQPKEFINSHYRYDMILVKPAKKQAVTVNYSFTGINLNQVKAFLYAADYLFSPPISSIVDIESYSLKLFEKSEIITASCEGRLIGILSFYANEKDKVAFIPYICVLKEFQRLNVAKELYHLFEEDILKRNYKIVNLEVYKENSHVLKFYEKIGFHISKEIDNNKVLLSKNIHWTQL